MTHLTPDELIDAVDAALTPNRRAHLDACDRCRDEAQALRALLGEVRSSDVPTPSPLFWDHFSARVRAVIADDATRPANRWFRWPVLTPLAALALLVIALVTLVSKHTDLADESETNIQVAVNESLDLESHWAILADLVDELDGDAREDLGLPAGPGVADRAVLNLSDAEQQELLRLLREELRVGG